MSDWEAELDEPTTTNKPEEKKTEILSEDWESDLKQVEDKTKKGNNIFSF